MFFLPEIPMTYIGEHYGWRVTIDINTGNFKVLRCLSSLYLYFCLCLYVFPICSFSATVVPRLSSYRATRARGGRHCSRYAATMITGHCYGERMRSFNTAE